jgi:hypothetical protein
VPALAALLALLGPLAFCHLPLAVLQAGGVQCSAPSLIAPGGHEAQFRRECVLAHRDCRRYHDIGFFPHLQPTPEQLPPTTYNLFRGFEIQQLSCNMFDLCV